MATPATIDSERLHQIADENIRADQNIYYLPCPGLANAIERNDEDEINQILDELFEPYYDKNIDAVVLGCTHYPFIKKEIAQRLPDAVLLDGSNGVAREARHQLIEHGWYNENDEPCHLEFTFTK